jgi:hypothetical protein
MTFDKLPEEFEQLTFSMSTFQINKFVVNSQHSAYRQFKQVLMELEVRKTTEETIKIDQKKNIAEQKLFDEKIAVETSPAQKEIYEIEKEKLIIALENSNRALGRTQSEAESLEKIYHWFKDNYDVQYFLDNQESLEEDYWIKRMGSQAALEILTVGRIGAGNLEAMLQMGEDLFKKTLVEATRISRDVQGQVKYLDMVSDEDIKKLKDNNDRNEIKEIEL